MPEMVASYPSQRFSALLDFQRNVDLVCPSHIGKKSPAFEAAGLLIPNNPKPNHHRGRHGDTSWQESWSESLTALLSSTFQRPSLSTAAAAVVASPPRPCAVESRSSSSSSFAVTRSQGQFSPQKFIRNALKRAFGRDEEQPVKRARFEDFGSTAEVMVCG